MRLTIRVALICLVLVGTIGGWRWNGVQLAAAQSPAPLASLEIALWPEYDRPEVLVIYRAQVAPEAPLPAVVTFALPASIQAMNAVAYLDEASDTLVNISDYRLSETASGKVLTLSTPMRRFQVEYYAPDLMGRQAATRTLAFSFAASGAVAEFGFEVQQPVGATEFGSTPPPDVTETHRDGLTYAFYHLGPLAASESRSLRVTYSRSSESLSNVVVGSVPSPAPPPVAPRQGNPLATTGDDRYTVLLIVPGVLAVGGVLAWVAWRRGGGRRVAGQRVPRRIRRETVGSVDTEESLAAFCHRCGTPIREDGLFCHVWGAPRRAHPLAQRATGDDC